MKINPIISYMKARIIKMTEKEKEHQHLQASNWKAYIDECIKTGLESPTPYKVIPYKNGIGIKRIEFIK